MNISSPYRTYQDVKRYAAALNIEVKRLKDGYDIISGATIYFGETLEDVFGIIRQLKGEN